MYSKTKALPLVFFLLWGCSTPGTKYEIDADSIDSEERTLADSYEKTWRAVQLAMGEYPIRINNQDSGILESEFLKSDQGFRPPGQEPTIGLRYKINVHIFRVSPTETRVAIRKHIERQKNFFSSREKVASDGLEELAIMYRVERELLLEKTLQKNENLDL